MFDKKTISRESLDKILKAQESKMTLSFLERENKIRNDYEDRMEKIYKKFGDQIDKIQDEHIKEIRLNSEIRNEKYKKIVEEKENIIDKLKEENMLLRRRMKSYKEAYELYKDYRDRLIEIAQKMGTASEKVSIGITTMTQFFSTISDLAEAQQRIGLGLDPKIEEKLYVPDIKEETRLRLIEVEKHA